jgi:hypothetical protein
MRLHKLPAARRSFAAAASAFAAALLLACWAGPARAQTATNRRDERRVEMETRQRALRSLSGINERPVRKQPDTRPSYQQVAEDFQQLQLSNYSLSGALTAGSELDYKKVEEDAAEVRRRASRLKSALALPVQKGGQGEKKAAPAPGAEGLKAAVAALDALVKSFVWNPVFRNPGVLDAENSTRAGRELEEILRLSEQVREAARALGKR